MTLASLIQHADLFFALSGLGAAGVAARYWYRVSKVPTVPDWAKGDYPFEPVVKESSQDGWIAGLLEASKKTAHLNRWGAIWTGISILLSATSVVLAQF